MAAYCNPIEHVFSNILPIFLGVAIMRSHILTAWIWFSMAIIRTLNDHSGYHLPFLPSPEAHDFHHLKYLINIKNFTFLSRFNNCYGVVGFLDWLHGTDKIFRANKAFSRHSILLCLKPAREVFREENTMKHIKTK